jgi:hypothetical protein
LAGGKNALAKVVDLAPRRPKEHLLVVNISGRGDKDIFTVANQLGGIAPQKRCYRFVTDHWVTGRAGRQA